MATNVRVQTSTDFEQYLHRHLLPIPIAHLEMRLYDSRLPGFQRYLHNDTGYESDVKTDFSDEDNNDNVGGDDTAGHVGDGSIGEIVEVCRSVCDSYAAF